MHRHFPHLRHTHALRSAGALALSIPLWLACSSGQPVGTLERLPVGGAGASGDAPPPTTPPDTAVLVDGCDIPAILSKHENSCANAGCHGERPQGGLDLVTAGIEQRLVGVASTTGACSGRLLVDPARPEQSLLLQAIDPARFADADHCGVMMPFGTKTGVSADDLSCFQQWVEKMAKDVPSSEPPKTVFEAVTPESYLSKLKVLLTGGAVTAAELHAVEADANALKPLVASWTETPEFSGKMQVFLAGALQQRIIGSINVQFDGAQGTWSPSLAANLQESFTRTAIDIVENDRPYTEVVTTRRWAATTATLMGLAYLDYTATALRSEKHQVLSAPTASMPASPLPLSYSVQNHAWVFPSIPAACAPAPQNLTQTLDMLLGSIHCSTTSKNFQLSKTETVLTAADFSDWRFVDLKAATGASPAPAFYDLETLRSANKLSLGLPRVGFFTSPAFLANWETNDDNQFRVTTSQTVITALGEIFSPVDQTQTLRHDGLSADHAAPGSTCYGCHQFLDPMRLYFAKTLSTRYHVAEKPMTGSPSFAFEGLSHDGGDLFTLATTLTQHPHFAAAWVQKLCYYANSQSCDEKDPEFKRIVNVFVDSKYNFKAMLRELFASPLVTGASPTLTYKNQANLVSITRNQHLCQLLDERLGMAGSCALAASFANLIPDDSFRRGSAVPVQPAITSLFHFSAAEKLCDRVASRVVGTGATSLFNPNQPEPVFDRLTQDLMGLSPTHSRYPAARAALSDHFRAARATGASATISMRSVFTLACLSPEVMALGL